MDIDINFEIGEGKIISSLYNTFGKKEFSDEQAKEIKCNYLDLDLLLQDGLVTLTRAEEIRVPTKHKQNCVMVVGCDNKVVFGTFDKESKYGSARCYADAVIKNPHLDDIKVISVERDYNIKVNRHFVLNLKECRHRLDIIKDHAMWCLEDLDKQQNEIDRTRKLINDYLA